MNLLLALIVFLTLLTLLLISAFIGRKIGLWQIKNRPEGKLGIVSVAEAAVFALLGLLIAFSFSGAFERYEARKMRIIEEIAAIDTAYERLALFAPPIQQHLQQTFRDYIDTRIIIYHRLNSFNPAIDEVNASRIAQNKLWQEIITACAATNNYSTTLLVIPAVEHLFEIAKMRLEITRIHTPTAIFVLLIGLAILSSYLAGYSTAKKISFSVSYIIVYSLVTAFTIYIIIDLEFPRLGLIRVEVFDKLLVDSRNHLE